MREHLLLPTPNHLAPKSDTVIDLLFLSLVTTGRPGSSVHGSGGREVLPLTHAQSSFKLRPFVIEQARDGLKGRGCSGAILLLKL